MAFTYKNDVLHCEDVAISTIAEQVGTPVYVYSRADIEAAFGEYQSALANRPHLICYAVKANSNLAVLNLLARLGAGFDIVSEGELARVIAAGGDPSKVVFSGVGKSCEGIRQALDAGIRCFNVESEAELNVLNEIAAECGKVAPVSLRVNPDVDANTHPYISTGLKENKFGVDIERAKDLYEQAAAMSFIEPVGVDCHIGSQLLSITPFIDAVDRLLALVDALESSGITLKHLDLGGGLGVQYGEEQAPAISAYIAALTDRLGDREFELIFEPGRSVVAMAGALVTRVNYLKPTEHRNFALVDAAMNDLIRPALYDAWMDILPATQRHDTAHRWDVVGPVCETGDFLGKDRELALQPDDLLVVTGAGAYGFVMASNYNTRPRPAEVVVDKGTLHVVRQREALESLWAGETCLPEPAS
ncbi:diaminopimelate decarboxylase [Luminiphilus syltensis NOR5-1B]|uniref:Diaminopimelate decarboxylase n=1 Tax=Luminiphilus syltensis NOR5-1B TaxID=565045 RepID=B8KSV0_9GAMM|nr:diaminopimelate decarboxylase [Luminiphilus syltensis]EED34863.1 diaminopimelate decarboxylase [Luminiphilus syltensis NOR5-1B]